MTDIFKRYFVGNTARIFSMERAPTFQKMPLRCFTGNSGGYYWLFWRITWRKPYAHCWRYNETRGAWEIRHD
jgi:hypothetical protein